jgi:hypothetical protein
MEAANRIAIGTIDRAGAVGRTARRDCSDGSLPYPPIQRSENRRRETA